MTPHFSEPETDVQAPARPLEPSVQEQAVPEQPMADKIDPEEFWRRLGL